MIVLRHLLWLEPFWVILLGVFITFPGRFFSIPLHPYIVAALFLFLPFRWLIQRRYISSRQYVTVEQAVQVGSATPITFLLLCLLCWLPINILLSADKEASWVAAGYLFWGIALCSACLNGSIRYRPSLTATFILLIGGGLAIGSPPIVAWKPDFRLFQLPLYSYLHSIPIHFEETIHANVLAGGLVIVLPIWFALTIQPDWTTNRWMRYLCFMMTLLVLGVLILTQSRGGYLALMIAFLFVLLLRWPSLAYIIPFVLLAVIISARFIALSTLMEEFSSDGSLGGWDVRLDIWVNSLQALSDFVYSGIGIGTFTIVMPLLYPLRYPIEGYPHAHNLFLQIGVDLGLPGLIIYLALLINLFVMIFLVFRSTYTLPLHRTLAIGATGSLVGMLIHGLLDAVTWGTKLAFVPWILFALITQLFLYTQATQATHKAASAVSNNAYPGK